ncbi:MAG: SUMF1/EgtB/PvdO family nonheme iron enzyme [Spirochaetia bacterium]
MKKKQIEVPEISAVKLKPLFGMHPGMYLTILYALILMILVFLVLFLPGIRNYGSDVRFTSAPAGAAVYIDGQYYGSTPFTRFVPAGTHSVRYEKPYFQQKQAELQVPGKLFGTLLFTRAEDASADLKIENAEQYLQWRFDQASDWALVGSFYERYRYPFRGVQTVSEYLQARSAEARMQAGSEESTQEVEDAPQELSDFVYMLINNINSFEQLIDTTAAIDALENSTYRGKTASEYVSTALASDLLRSSYNALTAVGVREELAALYVEAAARQQSIFEIQDESAYRADRELLRKYVNSLPFSEVYSNVDVESIPMDLYEHTFIKLQPPEQVPVGNSEFSADQGELDFSALSAYPHMEKLQPYYISSGEVTRGQFERFLRDSPEWRIDNVDTLIEQGKADENYLEYQNKQPVDMNLPVTNVSWYAAKAYCSWLERRLPADMQARYTVRLPSESEWEYAARKNSGSSFVDKDNGFDGPQAANYSREGRIGLVDMQGNVWEWCENWYFPADVLDGEYGSALPGYQGRERALRGGSWVNRSSEVPVWKRASYPPHWCSPFAGFRIVLEPKQE